MNALHLFLLLLALAGGLLAVGVAWAVVVFLLAAVRAAVSGDGESLFSGERAE